MISDLYIENMKEDLLLIKQQSSFHTALLLNEAVTLIAELQKVYRQVREDQEKEKASEATEAVDKLACVDLSDFAHEALTDMSEAFIECLGKYSNLTLTLSGGTIHECPDKFYHIKMGRSSGAKLSVSITTEIS